MLNIQASLSSHARPQTDAVFPSSQTTHICLLFKYCAVSQAEDLRAASGLA